MTKDDMITAANLSKQLDDLMAHRDAVAKAGRIELSCPTQASTKLVIRTSPEFADFLFSKVITELSSSVEEKEEELRALGIEL